MRRRPALDGLRAVAVLAVMAFHTSPAAHGGFLGVDVFFVVSGYLITALLLAEHDRSGRIDLRAFYRRRLLRLGPALLVMLALTSVLGATVLADRMPVPLGVALVSCLFYVSNWTAVVNGTDLGPFSHTWSLSIEEQFYLLWPVLLIAALARRGRPPVGALVPAVVAIVGSRLALAGGESMNAALYYATTSHSDGLLLGCLLAIALRHRARRAAGASPTGEPMPPPRWSEPVAWIGAAGLGGLMLSMTITGNATYRVGLAAAAICSVAIVSHLALAGSGPMVRLLSLRPLVAVGTVSYGLYLYHFPIFMLLHDRGYPFLVQHGLEAVLTLALTLASWHVIEKPVLRLKDRPLVLGARHAAASRDAPSRGVMLPSPVRGRAPVSPVRGYALPSPVRGDAGMSLQMIPVQLDVSDIASVDVSEIASQTAAQPG